MDTLKLMNMPRLSNEKQLEIMHKVKNGELSIEDALNQARQDKLRLLQRNYDIEEKQASQYNFSVHKFNTYRWQKRVFQIDFNTKHLCNIDKGIVKRQFPFARVKNCHDGAGTKFSVSFKNHHDYELEAMSPQDKEKMMEIINQIIYRNTSPVETYQELIESPVFPKRLHEGQLLLHRGGLTSFKWKRYDAHLYTGHLNLVSQSCDSNVGESDVPYSSSLPIIIHLSDGNGSVDAHFTADSFTVLTNKNEFHFRVATNSQMSTEVIRSERDAWVKAIDKLCKDWRRRSQSEHVYEDLKVTQEPSSVLESIKENQPENEIAPEKKWVQNYRSSSVAPPISKPQDQSTLSPADAAAAPVPVSVPEPVSLSAQEPEQVPPLSKPEDIPDSVLVPQVASMISPVPAPTIIHAPPVPPPLPKKKRQSKIVKEKTRAFYWDVIPQDKFGKSVWVRRSSREIVLDTSRLFDQFSVKGSGQFYSKESTHVEIMLNAKIAHNFNIFLKSFPVQAKELEDKLFIVDEKKGGLSDEHIASLRRYMPTADDIEMYKSYKGDVSELHVVDQYMLEMCNIPYLSTRLDLLLTLRELPVRIEDLSPLINQKIVMCQQLWGSDSFVCVLEYLLTVGNYLNQHAGKDKAKGFRLSSLTKLSQLRGNRKKFTLLHALVEQIMLQEPHLGTFFKELAEFETVPGASVKGLTAEVDVVKNELQKVIQYRKTYRSIHLGTQHSEFTKELKTVIEKYEADLSQLRKRCDEMRKLYADILVKFGEPTDQDSQELFGWVCHFINEFKKIQVEFIH